MIVGGGAFDGVCGAGKQMTPEGVRDELQEGEDASGTGGRVGGS